MEDMRVTTPSAIHPTMVQPCAGCGVMIEGYTRVICVRQAGWPMNEPHTFQLHPECVAEFAHRLLIPS
jgi:hypothetical protein